jgi:hypothetical protein
LRFAAGVCVLSTGLLIGSAGGAIAWAEPDSSADSSGSTAQSQASEGPSGGVATASAPAKSVANPLQTTLQSMTTVLRSLRRLGQQQSTDPKDAQTEPAAPSATDKTDGLGVPKTDPSPAASDSTLVASDQNVVASDSTLVASDQNAVVSDSNVAPPATDPLAPVATVMGPVTNAVAKVANLALSVPGLVASLPTSATPVADVITWIQDMLTAVTNVVVPLTQIASDLVSLLGMPSATAVATAGAGVGAAASAPVLATQAQRLEAAPIAIVGGMALPANIAPLATLGEGVMTGLSHEVPAVGIASPAQNVIIQPGLGSFLEHTVRALLVPASFSALAAVALPGVGGLLIICALGMRIGYRQAKTLFEVRRAGIASFAGPGPLGVVRSGSLIALSPRALGVRPDRALCVVRAGTSRPAGLQDQAA